MVTIQDLLQFSIEKQASDLHIIEGYFPTIRINNVLYPIKTAEIVTRESSEGLLFTVLNKDQKDNLLTNKEIDFGFEFSGYRFRVNYYNAKNSLAATFRLIPAIIKTAEQLNLPSIFHEFTNYHQGLVLITGPTGEGKSTTLASLINEINMRDAKHIVTIEDPIEFIYPAGTSIVSQRELHQDTHSWTIALKSVLREDPDVVLVGEMRDFDTIQAALTIAETGHLVFSTLHTSTTPEAINRIIDVFPPNQQSQIRSQLASVLKAVVSQRLVPNRDKTSRVPAMEILINVPAVASIIREGKIFMIDNVIETGEQHGMILFEKYLVKLVQKNMISPEMAMAYAIRAEELKKFLPA